MIDGEQGIYGATTATAVGYFQDRHGLPVDGICSEATWRSLVEAGWRLGDRLLYHRVPHLRGEDVADLQRRLGRLGFDAGRVDGIFGPATGHAVEEFQHNCGLPPDGICGYETIRALDRLGSRTTDGPAVAAVREQDQLRRAAPTMTGRRIVVGHLGGLGALARTVARRLRLAGATVITVDEPDQSAQATAANRFGADLYLGLGTATTATSATYYAVPGFESVGGRRLAELLVETLRHVSVLTVHDARGMRLAVLRETRMPAVLCELGPVRPVVDHLPRMCDAVVEAVTAWVLTPVAQA